MLRSTFKWLSALLAAILLVAAVFVVNLIWFRPFSLNLFYEKIFVSFLLEQPELLSSLGIAEQFGYGVTTPISTMFRPPRRSVISPLGMAISTP